VFGGHSVHLLYIVLQPPNFNIAAETTRFG
jgi:hypothetical protein